MKSFFDNLPYFIFRGQKKADTGQGLSLINEYLGGKPHFAKKCCILHKRAREKEFRRTKGSKGTFFLAAKEVTIQLTCPEKSYFLHYRSKYPLLGPVEEVTRYWLYDSKSLQPASKNRTESGVLAQAFNPTQVEETDGHLSSKRLCSTK